MRPEYNFDYGKAKPNRFAAKLDESRVVVVLDPDVSRIFPDAGFSEQGPARFDRGYAAFQDEAQKDFCIKGHTFVGERHCFSLEWGQVQNKVWTRPRLLRFAPLCK